MKTTRKIGVVTALLVSTAITSFAQDPVQSTSATWTFGGSIQADIPIISKLYVPVNEGYYIDAGVYFQQTSGFWNGGSDLNTLGVEVAYSFGL